MATRPTKQHKNEKAVRKVTAAERSALGKICARLEAKSSVRLKVSKNGSDWHISLDHPDELIGRALLEEAFASADDDFLNGIVSQLAKLWARSGHQRAGAQFHAVSHPKVLSQGISSRQCLQPRWRPSTWRA